MKTKAVIWREDKTNDVVVLTRKKIEGRTFKHDNCVYFIDPEASQITWTRPNKYFGMVREYFATLYYFRGVSTPFPISKQAELIIKIGKEAKVDERELEALKNKIGAKSVFYKQLVNLGISAEEMAALFEPWFYRQVAPKVRDMWDHIVLYACIGACAAAVYVAYMLITGNYELPAAPAPPTPTGAAP